MCVFVYLFVLRPLLFRYYSVAFVPQNNVAADFEERCDVIRNVYNANADEISDYIEDSCIGRNRRNAPRRPSRHTTSFQRLYDVSDVV